MKILANITTIILVIILAMNCGIMIVHATTTPETVAETTVTSDGGHVAITILFIVSCIGLGGILIGGPIWLLIKIARDTQNYNIANRRYHS